MLTVIIKKERELPDAYPSHRYRQAPQQRTSTEKFTPLWGMNPPHACSRCLKLAVSWEENKSSLLKLWYVSNGCRSPPWLILSFCSHVSEVAAPVAHRSSCYINVSLSVSCILHFLLFYIQLILSWRKVTKLLWNLQIFWGKNWRM